EPVSREQIASINGRQRGCCPSGIYVVDKGQPCLGKVTGSHGLRGDRANVIGGAYVTETFVITEEERAVPALVVRQTDRTSQGSAELVLFEVRPGRVKKIARVQLCIAEELPNITMVSIGTRAGNYNDVGSHRSALLARASAGLHRELLNGVHRRIHRVAVEHGVVVLCPVEKKVVEPTPLTVNYW